MTYQEIVEKTREIIFSYDLSSLKDSDEHIAVQVNIKGEGEGIFYIELKDGNVYIEPYEYYDRDCTFVISAENFFKICDGSLDAVKAFTVGKLKVLGNIDKVLKFSGIVKSVREQSENKKSKKKSK